jgi:DNA polymerase III subunit epsilon
MISPSRMAISLLSKLADVPLVFLDVETTGSSPAYGDRVTEVACLRIERGQITDEYARLVNPGRPIWPGITALTGISNEMVADAPAFADIAEVVASKLTGAVVIGHNVSFDLGFIDAELRRAAIGLFDVVEVPKVLDTVRLARRIYGRGGNGLQKLAARLCVPVTTAHRAMADCLTTAAVFGIMLDPLGGGQLSLADTIVLQGGPCKYGGRQEPALPIELDEALAAGGQVRMIYLDARNNRTERIVIPIQLSRPGPDRSLTAFCTLRQEQRSFKLTRIVELSRVEPGGNVHLDPRFRA